MLANYLDLKPKHDYINELLFDNNLLPFDTHLILDIKDQDYYEPLRDWD